GGVDVEVAGSSDGFPDRSAAVDGEVLVTELDGNGARRDGDVGELESGERLADELLNVRGRAGLGEHRNAADEVGLAHIGRDGEVRAGVLEVLILVDRSRVDGIAQGLE